MRRLRPPIASLVCLIFVSACAALHPPIQVEPSPSLTSDTSPLQLQPLRASPNGLHLLLSAEHAVPGDQLQIWRRLPDEDWTSQQQIDLDDNLVEALHRGQAQWSDPLPNESVTILYRLRLIKDDDASISAPLQIRWTGWPDPPRCLVSTTAVSARVVFTCDEDHPRTLRILRRDVLRGTDFEPRSIVDAAAGGIFHDTSVESGGVYAYRLQSVDQRHSLFTRQSSFSEPLYVAVPD